MGIPEKLAFELPPLCNNITTVHEIIGNQTRNLVGAEKENYTRALDILTMLQQSPLCTSVIPSIASTFTMLCGIFLFSQSITTYVYTVHATLNAPRVYKIIVPYAIIGYVTCIIVIHGLFHLIEIIPDQCKLKSFYKIKIVNYSD